MAEVSILIPTWNRQQYIGKAIETALAQTFQDIEVIVYNDGGDDNSAQIIQSIKDDRLKYISGKKNKGVAYARNRLLEACETPYGCWLDSDDLANKYRVELLLQVMRRYDPPFVRSSYTIYAKDDPDKWKRPPLLVYPKRHAVATSLFKKSIAPEFDNRIDCCGEDVVWELEIVNRYGTGICIPAALYDVRRGKHKRVSKRVNAKHLAEAFRQSERHKKAAFRRLRPQVQAQGFKDWVRVEYLKSELIDYPFEVKEHPKWTWLYDGVEEMSSRRING